MTSIAQLSKPYTGAMHKRSWVEFHYGVGLSFWKESYSRAQDDDHAYTAAGEKWVRDGGSPRVMDVEVATALAKWVDGGCRVLTTDARYFAAMAATRVTQDAVAELRIPWPAFVVEIPAGVLVSELGAEYRYALVAQFEALAHTQERLHSIMHVTDGTPLSDASPLFTGYPGSVSDLLHGSVNNWDLDTEMPVRSSEESINGMIRRAVLGLLYTMQHTRNWKLRSFPAVVTGKLREAPPPHRVIQIGRPISIDCIDSVRQAARGARRTPPSVQTLVRGHLKRQVVGAGRTGRKVIWVEPYWRGPETAPILSRPYRIAPPSVPSVCPDTAPEPDNASHMDSRNTLNNANPEVVDDGCED